MSDIDDLEDLSEQFRFGVNNPQHGLSKKQRAKLKEMRIRTAKASRSLAKQQQRSNDRRTDGRLRPSPNQH